MDGTQCQQVCELLLAEADVDAFSKQVQLSLFYDTTLGVAAF